MDDIEFIETRDLERGKMFQPEESKVIGSVPYVLPVDDDEWPVPYDITGEGLFSSPPNASVPTIDHGVDEEYIWNFPKDLYGYYKFSNPFLAGAD